MISSFRGEYAFLSNFYETPFPVCIAGYPRVALTAEHGFQAWKASRPADFEMVLAAPTAKEAKWLGRRIECREDWPQIRKEVMLACCLAKFSVYGLRGKLIATAPHILVEGNTWADVYWGAVKPGSRGFDGSRRAWREDTHAALGFGENPWYGENWLGRILMMVRDVLQ